MCGICLIFSLSLSVEDIKVMNEIKNYNESFNDNKEKSNNQKVAIQKENENVFFEELFEDFIQIISNRGPDYHNVVEMTKNNEMIECQQMINQSFEEVFKHIRDYLSMIMISSVLSLRGVNELTKQPIYNDDSNVLLYNGEIYSIDGNIIFEGHDLFKDNDGLILFEMLNKQIESFHQLSIDNKTNDQYITNVFNAINRLESDHAFIYIDKTNKSIIVNRDLFGKRSLLLVHIKSHSIIMITSVLPKAIYENRNREDITICEIPNNAIAIFNYSISSNVKQKIFYYPNKRIALPSYMRFNDDVNPISKYSNIIKECYNYLNKAVMKRICNLPQMHQSSAQINLESSYIGVLFSGGIDSLLLAYFTIINSPPFLTIDLFNLSFDKQNAPDRNSSIIAYKEFLLLFPHRNINLILIDKSFKENVEIIKDRVLQLIYPRETHMDFNISTALKFATMKEGYKVNINKLKDYFSNNNVTISNLDDIHSTNYNNNIISKQIAKIDYELFTNKENLYTSPAKIILSGLGADEFFGGYSRYKNGNLIEQMSKDINRIWIRNFGRDDRSCSDNGIELRFPFFDYDLLSFLSSIKDMNQVTNFDMKRGIGEKKLLRNIARLIGLNISSQFEKRAIQFGTKLAHETNMSKYGSNRKANGKAQFE